MMRFLAVAFLFSGSVIGQEFKANYPKPIYCGTVEATPVAAEVKKVPITAIGGASESADELFVLSLRLKNTSSTKRVDFSGWPAKAAFAMNFKVTDEHENRYKPVTFGLGSRATGDDAGETIEPEGERTAVIVFEKPIALANKLIVDLDGEAIGQRGRRLKWTISKDDWSGGGQQGNKSSKK